MNECPFCNPGIIEKQTIYKTATEYVIYNIKKANKGRCIVVPKRHVGNIRELTDQEAESLIKTLRFVSGKLKEYLKPEGINYGFNEGTIAGQMVNHFHFHILPRFKNDRVMQYHLFHGDPSLREEWNNAQISELVNEFRIIFSQL